MLKIITSGYLKYVLNKWKSNKQRSQRCKWECDIEEQGKNLQRSGNAKGRRQGMRRVAGWRWSVGEKEDSLDEIDGEIDGEMDGKKDGNRMEISVTE